MTVLQLHLTIGEREVILQERDRLINDATAAKYLAESRARELVNRKRAWDKVDEYEFL